MPVPGCNEPVKPGMQLQRTSFGNKRLSRASQSYDDLEDHYAALNISKSSRHGYAKIRPRNRPSMDNQTSKSQDMWAYKMDDSIVSPKYLFDHPVYASHSQLDAVPFLNKNLTSRSSNGAAPIKKKAHKIGPKTLNPKFVNPYSKVPIKLSNTEVNFPNYEKNENFPPPMILFSEQQQQQHQPTNIKTANLNNSKYDLGHQESFSYSQSSSSCEQNSSDFINFRNSTMIGGEFDEDVYSNEDYVDMTSESPDDDEQSVDEQYKRLTDLAMQQSTFGTG